ncbi:MAG: hypothetical protein ACKOHM_02795 [Spartobacteria bacterium]
MKIPLAILFFSAACLPIQAASDAPWMEQRSMEKFQVLLNRSPFSLPTAEESAPTADRFFLTGAATINNESVVFVLDKNTQARHMLGAKPDAANNQLLDYKPDSNPKNMSARIRIEGQEATIRYAELPSEAHPAPPMPVNPQMPQQPGAPNQQPGAAAVQPATQNGNEPPRRVIRRRVISGQPPAAQPVPNQ